MAKKSVMADPLKDVRAAWKHAQVAWGHTEASLAALAEAEAKLFRSLGGAGADLTKKAKAEINATIKMIDRKRKAATKQIENLAKRQKLLHKPAAARGTKRVVRKSAGK